MEILDRLNAYIWVFGWAIIMYLFHRDATRRRLHKQELIHKERLHAIDKGVAYPELPPYDGEEAAEPLPHPKPPGWCLGTGAVLVMGGVGVVAALLLMKDHNWPLGLIPGFLGVGLWLNYWLTRAGERK